MTTRMRCTSTPSRSEIAKIALATVGAVATIALSCAAAQAAETVSPLPPSDYSVRAACSPPAPGHATCLALQLVAQSAAAKAHTHPIGITRAAVTPLAPRSPLNGGFGLRPQDLHSAYQLPFTSEATTTQTIAVVDAYNDPHAEADLEAYDTEFGLPQCTAAEGCFEQLGQNGEAGNLPFPESESSLTSKQALCNSSKTGEPRHEEEREEACFLVEEAEGWSVEISLDLETARAVCQNCHIALVEANSTELSDLEAAEESAARLGAQEISNSWGGPECIEGLGCEQESPAFNHPGVVIAVAAGDDGYRNWLEEPKRHFAGFPASLPTVVAVGGTRLLLSSEQKRTGETVWNDGGRSGGIADGHGAGGGGCSVRFGAEPWQQSVADWSSVGCASKRAVADLAADADPYTGLAVYDNSPECEYEYEEHGVPQVLHWCTIGGTSLASPLIASVFALAGGANGVKYPARTLYENAVKSPGSLFDVSEGSNGECTSPFDESTKRTACTFEAEAKASCSGDLICLAASGYDGPTGLGTPEGLAAFQPPAGAGGEEEEEGGKGSGSEGGEPGAPGGPPAPAAWPPPVNTSPYGPPTGTTTPPSGTQPVQLSALALTTRALIALNASRPRRSALAFSFTSNVAVHVRVSLEKRVRAHGHRHWKLLTHPFTIAAVGGRNRGRLTGHGALSPGTYRLVLAPVHGSARSLVFSIG